MTFYPLATETWDADELAAIDAVVKSRRFTMGPEVKAFEQQAAAFFGARYAVMVNSGSSANLLAIAGLVYHPDHRLKPSDNIIVPAVSWGTTYYPIAQYGLELRFVDVDRQTLNLDVATVERAIDERTRAVFAVNLLGNPCDLPALRALCDGKGLLLIEDNCESMGATIGGRQAGTFGICGTYSTFFSHHISTMEGGLLLTDDRKLADICVSLRAHGWLREQQPDSHLAVESDEFVKQFRFVLPGYNLRPLEMSGAIGQQQLRKLPSLVAERRKNALVYQRLFQSRNDLTIQAETGVSSWFGFSFTLGGRLAGRRAELVERFRKEGIESRPIVAGNFTKNPVIDLMSHSFGSALPNAEAIDTNGFFLGNHHYSIETQLSRVREIIDAMP